MRCRKCSSTETKVLETRTAKDSASIRRRRECIECNHRFTTIEEILREDAIVVKRDGRRESFDRSKIIAGIRRESISRSRPSLRKWPFVDLVREEQLPDFGKSIIHLIAFE